MDLKILLFNGHLLL